MLSRAPNSMFALLLLLALSTLASALPSASETLREKRDAFTNVVSVDTSANLTSVGNRPVGAYGRNFKIGGGSLFTWYSKSPIDANTTAAMIIIHGKLRDSANYWTILNHIFTAARNASQAEPNTIRVAPQFFSSDSDTKAMNATSLGYGDSNGWAAGDASTKPAGVKVSSFTVLDHFLDYYSNAKQFPKLKTITFVGHGAGGQMIGRYAALGKDARSGISVRYVVGDPSTELSFTIDRPVAFSNCSTFNDYRYGLNDYSPGTSYPLAFGGDAVALFKRFMARDVRHVVGGDDTDDSGDQTCMAQAKGGVERTMRNQAYWKYINLLGQSHLNANVSGFFGSYPALGTEADSTVLQSDASTVAKFRGTHVNHRFALIAGAQHNAQEVYETPLGRSFLFNVRETLQNSLAPVQNSTAPAQNSTAPVQNNTAPGSRFAAIPVRLPLPTTSPY